MAQSQTIDDAEDEVFLRRLIRPEEERRRLHPTRFGRADIGGLAPRNVLPIERYRNRPKGQGSA